VPPLISCFHGQLLEVWLCVDLELKVGGALGLWVTLWVRGCGQGSAQVVGLWVGQCGVHCVLPPKCCSPRAQLPNHPHYRLPDRRPACPPAGPPMPARCGCGIPAHLWQEGQPAERLSRELLRLCPAAACYVGPAAACTAVFVKGVGS